MRMMAREYRYSIKDSEHYFHRLDLTRVALERMEALVDETKRVADATERVAAVLSSWRLMASMSATGAGRSDGDV